MQKDVTITLQKKPKSAVFYDIYGNEHSCEMDGNKVICKNANTHIYDCVVVKITY